MIDTFGETSTTDDVLARVDVAGRRVLVTGVSAGLGIETARALAAHGAHVVGAVRDMAKAERAMAEARAQAQAGGGIELVDLDLSSLESVRACADALLAADAPFDLIITNAGTMGIPFGLTADGFEMHFATNHLGHFVLVNRLTPLLAPQARVVSVASAGHRFGTVDLDDPNFERTPYQPMVGYGRSKTANILFAVEFDRRWRDRGLRAMSVHPGRVETEITRYWTPELSAQVISEIDQNMAIQGQQDAGSKTYSQGAATYLWAGLLAPGDEVGGRYCADCRVQQISEAPITPVSGGVRAYALDPETAKALWTRSEEMVGERFD